MKLVLYEYYINPLAYMDDYGTSYSGDVSNFDGCAASMEIFTNLGTLYTYKIYGNMVVILRHQTEIF